MGQFTSENQPQNRGRKVGSKNKRSVVTDELHNNALKKLEQAVELGEPWAIEAVLKRCMPTLKPITPVGSLDGEMLEFKIKELSDFEERLEQLEEKAKDAEGR